MSPIQVMTASTRATTSIQTCDQKSSLLRSTVSANTPARKPTRKTGSVEAVWTNPTSVVEEVSDVISHAAPTDCMSVPTLETMFAIQRLRKAAIFSGADKPGDVELLTQRN